MSFFLLIDIAPKPNHNRCPLCHTDIQATDEAWIRHLTRPGGCPANPRLKGM